MRFAWIVLLLLTTIAASPLHGQRKRAPARKPAAPPPPKVEPAQVKCSELLGTGVKTHATFCFVLFGPDPAKGVLVSIPKHTGTATLIFDLHNRHTYSEEEMKAGRGFAKYTASVVVFTLAGEQLGRGAVQTEFRSGKDLFDRIAGGAGPGGTKAVAPLGVETVRVQIPQNVDQVSIVGELLDATTAAGRETATLGRPVALVSNVQVEYRPAPAPRRR